MLYKELYQLFEEAEGAALDSTHPDDDVRERLDDVSETIDELADDDIGEWIAEFYREEYRAWKDGDAEKPCHCTNPRCSLKRGELPYQIRRPTTPLRPDESSIETRLRNYLKKHSQARVLDDALAELRTTKREAASELREIIAEHDRATRQGVE